MDGRYLIYLAMDGALVAAPYDPTTFRAGRAVTLLTGIRREGAGEAQYDLSADGDLIYASGPDGTIGQLVTLRRGGMPVPLRVDAGDIPRFDLSRDRRRVAVSAFTTTGMELRIYDLRDGQHYSQARAEVIRHPLWSPDGTDLILMARNGSMTQFRRLYPGEARGEEVIFSKNLADLNLDLVDYHDPHLALAQDWRNSLVFRIDPSLPTVTLDTVLGGARFASLSPNAKLVSFQSREGSQVIVTTFPVPGRLHVLATQGVEPIWLSPSEVLYRTGFSWYLVRVDLRTGEPQGAPVLWGHDPRFNDTSGWSNRPSWDGGIIYMQGPAQTTSSYLRVIPNWVDQMKDAVDAANR